MPNRNSNWLMITAKSQQELDHVKQKIIKPGTEEFSLLVARPMPEELDLPRSPIDIVPDGTDKLEHIKIKHAYLFTDEYASNRTPEQVQKEINNRIKTTQTVSENQAIRAKYWTDDWYHWMHQHIGCKRDCSDCTCYVESKDAGWYNIYVSFDTPRCPPIQWFEHMCHTFPNVFFHLDYEEPGMQFQWSLESMGNWDFVNHEEDYVERCDRCEDKDETCKYYEDTDQNLCDNCHNQE